MHEDIQLDSYEILKKQIHVGHCPGSWEWSPTLQHGGLLTGTAAHGLTLSVAYKCAALCCDLLGWWHIAAVAARSPGQLAVYLACGQHGCALLHQFQLLEHRLPGHMPCAILAKVLWDQAVSMPIALLALYTGVSTLQGRGDIFLYLKQKFWNTYKTGLMYWPFIQLNKLSFVPIHWRTVYIVFCGPPSFAIYNRVRWHYS